MTVRPHRDLCPEAAERDEMDEAEFWERVYPQHGYEPFDDGTDQDLDAAVSSPPCTLCGASGACGWDSEGRPMIHAISEEDSDS